MPTNGAYVGIVAAAEHGAAPTERRVSRVTRHAENATTLYFSILTPILINVIIVLIDAQVGSGR